MEENTKRHYKLLHSLQRLQEDVNYIYDKADEDDIYSNIAQWASDTREQIDEIIEAMDDYWESEECIEF